MIELNDQSTGNTVGNAVCYMAKNTDNNPIMVIDNIELAAGYQNNMKVREGITEFTKAYSKAVTKGKEIPIYLGQQYNDVPESDLKEEKDIKLKFIGKALDDELYLDSLKGWINELDKEKTSDLFILHKL